MINDLELQVFINIDKINVQISLFKLQWKNLCKF